VPSRPSKLASGDDAGPFLEVHAPIGMDAAAAHARTGRSRRRAIVLA
jgi:hypothetical protein